MTTRRILVAAAMVVVGLAIFVPSGLCAGAMGGFQVLSDWTGGRPIDKETLFVAQLALALAGPVMAAGLTLIGFGIFHLLRK